MFIITFAKEAPSKMSDTFLPRSERLEKDQPYKNSCSVISYEIVNEQEIWNCPKTVVI